MRCAKISSHGSYFDISDPIGCMNISSNVVSLLTGCKVVKSCHSTENLRNFV